MRILLLYPNAYGMNMIPPAMGIFTAMLKKNDYTVDLFDTTQYQDGSGVDFDMAKAKNLNARPYDDLKLKESVKSTDMYQDFRSKVDTFCPDLIAMSVTEDMYPRGVSLLKYLGTNRPMVVTGGVFPTFVPKLVINESHGSIDIVLKGEGEESLLELCQKLNKKEDITKIRGLVMLDKNDNFIENQIPYPIDVNNLTIPDYSLFEESRFYRPMQGKLRRMLPISTIRGCPYRCTYCNSPSQMDMYKEAGMNFFRKVQADKMIEEIKVCRDLYKADSFYFWADTFLAWNKKEFDEFCDMYKEIGLPFWIQTRPETVTEYKMKRLKEIGLLRIAFGIEHGNEEFRAKMLDRNVKNELIIEKLKIVTDLKIPISVNNIMGFPNETRELAFDTIELNRQIASDGINAYTFVPFHGTPLRSISEKLGFVKPNKIVSSLTNVTMLDMPQFKKEEIEGIRRCFVLYVKMPKNRWPDIKKAESLTPSGDEIWEALKLECNEKYMNYGDYDESDDIGTVDFEKEK